MASTTERKLKFLFYFNINLVKFKLKISHIGLMAIIKHCISRQLKVLEGISAVSVSDGIIFFLFGVKIIGLII